MVRLPPNLLWFDHLEDMTIEPECEPLVSVSQHKENLFDYPWKTGEEALQFKKAFPQKTIAEIRAIVMEKKKLQ